MANLVRIRGFADVLTQIEIWPVALMIGASVALPALLPAAVCTAAVFWFLRWVASGHAGLRTPLDWEIILFLGMIPVTIWATSFPGKTMLQVYRLLSGVAIFYALVNWCNSTRRLRLAILSASLAGMLLAGFSTISVHWSVGKLPIPSGLYQKFVLLVADTVHPNVMAGSLILLFPIPSAWLLFGWGKIGWIERILASMAALAMGAVLVLTQSRGAWIGLSIVIVTLTILRWRWGWLILIIATMLALVTINRFGFTPLLELLSTSGTINSIDGRIETWSRAIFIVKDFPFTGIGMGSFTEVADVLYPFFLAAPGTVPHAHNQFLQIAVDLGVPGLIAWLAILMLVVLLACQLYSYGRIHHNIQSTALGAGLLCSQLALVVHGLSDAVTWGMVRPAPIVWAVWGLTVASWVVNIQSKDNIQ